MLALRVEYLTGVCMATRHNDPSRSTPEWPPHPDRLYSALVAAAAEPDDDGATRINDDARKALAWLAERGAPRLHAGRASHRSTPDVHMPANPHEDEVWQKPKNNKPRLPQKSFDLKSLLPVHRKKAALPIPAVAPEEPVAHFIWPDAEANDHLEMLREICERVTYLGRSRSLVRVSVVDDPPEPTHVPDPLGQVQLRVPGSGRLDELIAKHERDGGKPPPSPPHRYRRVGQSERDPQTLRTVFDRMWVFRPARGDPGLPAVSTMKLTQTLRRALLRCVHEHVCGCDQWKDRTPPPKEAAACYGKIPTLISGHEPGGERTDKPHIAFAALPFVHPRQRHADGAVKGVAVAVPHDAAHDDLTQLAHALERLQDNGLDIPGVGKWHLEEVEADNPPLATLDIETWTKPSRLWTTATPMVFGHFPKPNKGGEAKVILESLEMVGIDRNRVLEIAVDRHSPLHGAPPSWCFKPRRDKDNGREPRRWMRHVTLRFDQPVRGPLLLGCKRYFGLGLMRPVEE